MGDETGWVRQAVISKGHYEVGSREKEPCEAVRSMLPIVSNRERNARIAHRSGEADLRIGGSSRVGHWLRSLGVDANEPTAIRADGNFFRRHPPLTGRHLALMFREEGHAFDQGNVGTPLVENT